MQQPSFHQINDFYSKAYTAMQDYAQINTRFWNKCTEQQLEFLQLSREFGEREFELWTNGKDLSGCLAAQSNLAMEFSKKFADRCGAALASCTEAGTETMSAFEVFKGYWTPTSAPEQESTERPPRAPKAKKADAA